MGKSLRAFVVHDWLYSIKCGYPMPQRKCDAILYQLGLQDGESWFDAQSINKGLALGGWTCYKKSKPIVKPVSRSVLVNICESNRYRLKEWSE
jgi:hypothetical protein